MNIDFTAQDRKKIEEGIRGKFAKVAVNPEGLFRYPTGRAGLEGLKYDPGILKALPESALESFCGVGNPFSLGEHSCPVRAQPTMRIRSRSESWHTT